MHLFCIFMFEGCGMALDPEDTPYLEILCVRDPRDEESMMETRDGDRDRQTENKGDPQEITVEKQNSLITLAWSKPAHGKNHIQVCSYTQTHALCLKSAQTVHSAGSDLGSTGSRGCLYCSAWGYRCGHNSTWCAHLHTAGKHKLRLAAAKWTIWRNTFRSHRQCERKDTDPRSPFKLHHSKTITSNYLWSIFSFPFGP